MKLIQKNVPITVICIVTVLLCAACTSPAAQSTSTQSPVLESTISLSTAVPSATSEPTPEATPEPTPEPTPTPDPEDAYFLPEDGELIEIDENRTAFTYRTRTLSIEVNEHINEDKKLRYYVAHIRTRGEAWQFGYGDGKAPGNKRLKPYRIARNYQAVFAQNGDFFIEPENPLGVVIRAGTIFADDKRADTLAFLPDGSLEVYEKGSITAQELLDQGVENTMSFGPILVQDGTSRDLSKSRLGGRNPRSGLGMVKNGHYVAIVVDGRTAGLSAGATMTEFADMFVAEGCVLAYNMDGGQSSGMVFMGDSCNTHAIDVGNNIHGQRPVPDVFWIGVSDQVPEEKAAVINDGQGNMKDPETVESKKYANPNE